MTPGEIIILRYCSTITHEPTATINGHVVGARQVNTIKHDLLEIIFRGIGCIYRWNDSNYIVVAISGGASLEARLIDLQTYSKYNSLR